MRKIRAHGNICRQLTAQARPRFHLNMEKRLLQEQLVHEYSIGNGGNAKQGQHQSAHDLNADNGHQVLVQPTLGPPFV